MKNLDKYVVTAMLYIFGWSIVFYVSWLITREEPSVLEGCILAPGLAELGFSAWIKQGKKEKKDEGESDTETDEQEVLDGTDSVCDGPSDSV